MKTNMKNYKEVKKQTINCKWKVFTLHPYKNAVFNLLFGILSVVLLSISLTFLKIIGLRLIIVIRIYDS
jgi:hypothetical protein